MGSVGALRAPAPVNLGVERLLSNNPSVRKGQEQLPTSSIPIGRWPTPDPELACCWQPVQYNPHIAKSPTDIHACARFAICRCCFPEVHSASRSGPPIGDELPEARTRRVFRQCAGCPKNWPGPPSVIEPYVPLRTDLPAPGVHTVAPSQPALYSSTSTASARNRQRRLSIQAIGPCLHCLVVDDATHIHISQGFMGEAAAFFFLFQPSRECLFHDPASGALKTRRHLVYLLGKRQRYVRGENFGRGVCHVVSPYDFVKLNRSD